MPTRMWPFLRIVLGAISLVGSSAAVYATPATDWLQQQSQADGVYESATPLATRTQSTSEAILALEARDLGDAPDVQLARDYLTGASAITTEQLARRIRLGVSRGNDVAPLISALETHQNRDGGFGDRPAYTSTALDSAWALEAFALSDADHSQPVGRAIGFLMDRQKGNGSWIDPGASSAYYTTALVLRALARHRRAFELDGAIEQARTFLLNARDTSGAIGAAYESAAALLAIAPTSDSKSSYADVVASIEARQEADGSWGGGVFATALAIQALALAEQPQPNPQLGSIELELVDTETGAPLQGIEVVLGGDASRTASTAADGGISFDGLPAGNYVIDIDDPDYSALHTETSLSVGQNKDLGVVRLLKASDATAAAIQGTITDAETGSAIEGATFLLTGDGTATTVTDFAGRFVIDQLAAGNYLLEIRADGYAAIHQSITLTAGSTLILSRALEPAAGVLVRGTVTAQADGQPISAATVTFDGASSATATTDTSGNYEVSDLSAGRLTIGVAAAGFEPASVNIDSSNGQRLDFSPTLVAQGEPDPAPESAAIRGVVVDAVSDAPIGGATVTVSIDGETADTTTDTSGVFSLSNVPAGSAGLEIAASGYRPTALALDTAAGVTIDLGEVALTPANADAATATGVLLDSITNQPLGGQTIEIRFEGDTWSAVSEGDGSFTFNAPAEIEGVLSAAPEGYVDTELPVLLVPGENDLSQLRVRPKGIDQLLPDLAVRCVQADQLRTTRDPIAYDASLTVEIENRGTLSTPEGIAAMAFVDIDGDQRPTAGDVVLGEAESPAGLVNGESIDLDIPVVGSVPFRDAPVTVWVDSGQVVAESDEDNNTGASPDRCPPEPTALADLEITEKWHWSGWSGDDSMKHVQGPIIVAQLSDDNGDGAINSADTPDLVFGAGNHPWAAKRSVLVAVDGATGAEIWSRREIEPTQRGPVAVGDIDDDGMVEIVAVKLDGTELIAVEHDGSEKWRAPTETSDRNIEGGPAIANIDGTGPPEIVFARSVYNADGSLRWRGTGDRAEQKFGPLSIVADINLDGLQEVIAGRTVYRSDGTILWTHSSSADGYNAVGNFDDDDQAEVVLVQPGPDQVYLVDSNGETIWGPVGVPGSGGGPPTVADVDGDGEPEIGIATSSRFLVLETDGSLKWSQRISDGSARTGSTMFDLNDDGRAELFQNDHSKLRIYDGPTGEVVAEIDNGNTTTIDYPIIADVDGDLSAEIAVGSSWRGSRNGVRVFEPAEGQWAATRAQWNQHSYHITNINSDGSIPVNEEPSWLAHNTYRLNRFVEEAPFTRTDVSASRAQVIDAGPGSGLSISVRVGNSGSRPFESPIEVSFFDGDPAAGGVLLGSRQANGMEPAKWQDSVLHAIDPSELSGAQIFVVVDASGSIDEYREDNNVDRTQSSVPSNRGSVSVGSDAPSYPPGSPVNVSASAANEGTFAGDFQVGLHVEDMHGDLVADLGETDLGTLASGESGSASADWNTEGIVADTYSIHATLYGSDGSVADQAATTVVLQSAEGDLPTATVDTSSSAAVHGRNGTVNIQHVVRNVSPNAVLFGAELTTIIIDPDGMERARETIRMGDLLAGAQRRRLVNHVLVSAPEGTWTVEGVLRDAQGTLLARDRARFDVDARPLEAVSGTVEALHPVRIPGEPQTCTELVTNNGDRPIQDLTVRRLVLNRSEGTSVSESSETLAVPAGASDISSRGVSTDGLTPGVYSCVLQVRDEAEWRTLDTAEFEVEVPPIRLEGEITAGDRGRLLVLLDPPGGDDRHCKGHARIDIEGRFKRALNPRTRLEVRVHDHRGRLVDSEVLHPKAMAPINVSDGFGADLSLVEVGGRRALLRLKTTTSRPLDRHYSVAIRAWHGGRMILSDRERVHAGCRRHDRDRDGDEAHGHTAGSATGAWFGWGGWRRNRFDAEVVDLRPWPPEEADRLSEREWLEQVLDGKGWSYRIVTDADAFWTELRSGAYEGYALLAGRIKLPVLVQRELHAAVARGAGLLAAGWHDGRNHFLFDTLGVRFRGRLHGVDGVDFNESPLHPDSGDMHSLEATDKPLRVCVAEGDVAARYVGDDRRWRWSADSDAGAERHGANGELAGAFNQDHRQTGWQRDRCGGYHGRHHGGGHHRARRRDAAVTYRELLDGRSVFAGFDLLAEARVQGDGGAFEALLTGALDWSHPVSLPNPVDAVRGYEVTVNNLGIATPGRVILEVPDTFEVVDPGEGTVNAEGAIEWTFDLDEGDSFEQAAWLRLPQSPGPFTLEARIQSGTPDSFLDQATADLPVEVTARPTLEGARADACAAGWRYWPVCGLLKLADRKIERGRYRHALIKLSIAEWKLRHHQFPPGPAIHAGVLHGIRRVERLWWSETTDAGAP